MHLQSSLYVAVVFIVLGFAFHTNKNGLARSLTEKSLTYAKPGQAKSADAIHQLAGRDTSADGICNVIYNCPTAGTGVTIFRFSGTVQQNQNQGGTLSCSPFTGQGLLISRVPDKTFSIFPAHLGVDWTVSKTLRVADQVCLIDWTFSVGAYMPTPNFLAFTPINNHQVKEVCATVGDVCSQPTLVSCTTSQGTGC